MCEINCTTCNFHLLLLQDLLKFVGVGRSWSTEHWMLELPAPLCLGAGAPVLAALQTEVSSVLVSSVCAVLGMVFMAEGLCSWRMVVVSLLQ